MDNFETNFIPQTVEKTPFADTPAQNFFAEWCRINDSIIPEFISREEWGQRGVQGILEKNDQGKQTLFLPTDLHLWEMMDVIKTVDHDTLARKPEKREERANQIQELGVTFEKAGLYLSEYLPDLDKDKGKQIAQDIASKFYQYGLSLQHKKQETAAIPEGSSLSEEDKTKLDQWFLGRDVYQKRITRLGENPTKEQIENTRKKILKVYFKALAREGYKADGENPWETKVGPIKRLQNRTIEQITKAIKTPEREMTTALFRRGVEKLVTEMKYPFLEQRKLYDTLHIDELKQELEEIRQIGDVSKTSAKELQIAKNIHQAVASFPYDLNAQNPSEMVETQFINCVGSSILGGGLLDEVGIKYLHADLPEHSATVLITSDGKVYWQDFTPGNLKENYTEITTNMVDGGMDLSNVTESGKTLHFIEWNPYNHQVKGKLRVRLLQPEMGSQCAILNNTGNTLLDLDRKEEAIEAYQKAIMLDPENATPYNGLGSVLSDLGRKEEVVDIYKKLIQIEPGNAEFHNNLGIMLCNIKKPEESIKFFNRAIAISPGNKKFRRNCLKIVAYIAKNGKAI